MVLERMNEYSFKRVAARTLRKGSESPFDCHDWGIPLTSIPRSGSQYNTALI